MRMGRQSILAPSTIRIYRFYCAGSAAPDPAGTKAASAMGGDKVETKLFWDVN